MDTIPPQAVAEPILQFGIIVGASVFVSVIVRLITRTLVQRIIHKTTFALDDIIFEHVKTPLSLSIVLLGIYVGLNQLNNTPQLSRLGHTIIIITLILYWTYTLYHLLGDSFDTALKKTNNDAYSFIKNMSKLLLLLVASYLLLSVFNVDVTPLLASAGIAGIAIAFAAQDMVANLFGGVSIFFDKPFQTGDYVIIGGQHRGQVLNVGVRSTKIRTRDNVLLTVPNSVMVTDAVINETGFDPKFRVRIPIGVAYNSDLEKVEEVLLEILAQNEAVLDDDDTTIRYRRFGNSAIELEVLAMVSTPMEQAKVVHDLIKEITKKFREEGITIPFPQREVRMIEE